MGDQRLMRALLEPRALPDQAQPKARPLTRLPDGWAGQPDRRHKIAARELGQHPGVDPVGLAGERREPLRLRRVGDLDLPPVTLELVMHKPRPGHRLDRRANPPRMTIEPPHQPRQTVRIRRRGRLLDQLTALIEHTHIEPTTTQIQTNMQHEDGPPWTRSPMNTPERATEEALLHRIYRCRRRGKHRAAPHGRPAPSDANRNRQPPAASRHRQPPAASRHRQPPAASRHRQPPAASRHRQPPTGTASREPEPPPASRNPAPPAASREPEPPTASRNRQPRTGTASRRP